MKNSMLLNKVLRNIQYVSDIHLEKGFKRYITPKKPFLILSGDIGYPSDNNYKTFLLDMSKYFDKVFIISGNHEYDNVTIKDMDKVDKNIENICEMRHNLFYLQKQTHLLCAENNISLAGCTYWSTLPFPKRHFHNDHKNWINNLIETNKNNNYIVATHHCPSFDCLNKLNNKNTHYYFASSNEKIFDNDNLLMWIYGHSHINKNFFIKNTFVTSNQYGSFIKPCSNYKK